jgi:hypothetical protein
MRRLKRAGVEQQKWFVGDPLTQALLIPNTSAGPVNPFKNADVRE